MTAEAWLASERRIIEFDTWTTPEQRATEKKAAILTLGDYTRDWIKHRPIKPGTKKEYQGLADSLIAPLSDMPIRTVTDQRIREWFASLNPETARRNSHAYGLLHAICATAVRDGLLPSNPCGITRAMNPSRKREPVILDVKEIVAVGDSIQPRYRALILIAAWCGLRWGETIELRRKDIGSGCEIISVARAASHRGACRIDTTKSGKARNVIVPPHIRADIKNHLDVFVSSDPESLVFPTTRNGCHINDSVFMRSAFRPALKSIGREGVRIHDLRHFAGSQAARVGNLVEVMNRLGHSTVKASLIYQQMVNGRDAELADQLSALAAQ
jgi:integrase